MVFTDFKVKYDPDKETPQDLTKKIINSIFIRRLKNKKPAITFISGDSGEGKSYSALKLQETILEILGLDINKYLDVMNVYIPIEYPIKIQKLLYDKEYKKVNVITLHEAREVIKAKEWHSFLNQSIADINAMTRSVKRLCVFIVSQFIRDISSDIRYTLNYYIKVKRAMGGNRRARLYISVVWKDDRDMDKPKLRKRRLSGIVVYPDNRHRRYTPIYLELTPPSKEVAKKFDEADFNAKSKINKGKLNKLLKEMQKDLEVKDDKIEAMVSWYVKNPDSLNMILKRRGSKISVKPYLMKMHDVNKEELKLFEEKLLTELSNKEVVKDGRNTEVEGQN